MPQYLDRMPRYRARPEIVEAAPVPEDVPGMIALAKATGGRVVQQQVIGGEPRHWIEYVQPYGGIGLLAAYNHTEIARPGMYVVRSREGQIFVWAADTFEAVYALIEDDPLDLAAAREDRP